MNPRSRQFLILLGVSSLGFASAALAVAELYRVGDDWLAPLPWAVLSGTAFIGAAFATVAPLKDTFGINFTACIDSKDPEGGPGYRLALEMIGGAPLVALIRLFLLIVVLTVITGLVGWNMGLEGAAKWQFALLILALGMLAASFVYVISDGLGLKVLLDSKVSFFPPSLRENRQQRKIFIIPIFMSLMSVVYAFATAFLVSDRAQEAGIWVSMAGVSVVYLGVVITLVSRWTANTAQLYRSVLAQLDRLTQGERDLTSRISIGSVDEIGSISGRVNSFCDSLAEGLRQVASIHEEVVQIQTKLFSGITQVSEAAHGIGASIQTATGAVVRADEALGESLARTNELASHAADASAKIAHQSDRVAASSRGVLSMMEAVGRLAQDLEGARTKTKELSQVVQDGEKGLKSLVETVNAVANRSADLEKINKLIAGVAARTNLLAMNAAIEAAHAGEAGRGFSVVAEEIRTLAESTADHTRHSKKSLSEILQLIQGALVAARAAGDSFSRVHGSANEVSEVTAQVSSDMGREGQRSAEILQLLAETEELGQHVAATARTLDRLAAAAAEQLSRASREETQAEQAAQTMTKRNQDLNAVLAEVTTLAEKTSVVSDNLAAFLRTFRT